MIHREEEAAWIESTRQSEDYVDGMSESTREDG